MLIQSLSRGHVRRLFAVGMLAVVGSTVGINSLATAQIAVEVEQVTSSIPPQASGNVAQGQDEASEWRDKDERQLEAQRVISGGVKLLPVPTVSSSSDSPSGRYLGNTNWAGGPKQDGHYPTGPQWAVPPMETIVARMSAESGFRRVGGDVALAVGNEPIGFGNAPPAQRAVYTSANEMAPSGQQIRMVVAQEEPATQASASVAPALQSPPPQEPNQEQRSGQPKPPAEKRERKERGSEEEKDTIGVPPAKEQPQFLRNESILLKPGDYQWEWGVNYTVNSTVLPIGQALGEGGAIVTNLRQVNRVMQMPLELRVGLSDTLQGAITVPFGWSNSEISVAGIDEFESEVGIGDVGLSLTKSLRTGDFEKASILGLLAMTFPTGEATLASSLQDPSASLGRGYYSLTSGLTFIRTFDPIVLYGGLGYIFNFEGEVGPDTEVNAGDGAFYRLGLGFAVNSQVSLSSAFSGAFLGNAEINGRRIGGSSREPMSIRIAATILQKQKEGGRGSRSVEPFLNFALTDDASDAQLGIAWTY